MDHGWSSGIRAQHTKVVSMSGTVVQANQFAPLTGEPPGTVIGCCCPERRQAIYSMILPS